MALHPQAEQFFDLLGANEKFIVSKTEFGNFKTTFFTLGTAEFYDRISLGETSSTYKYTVDSAIRTKVIAVIDIDTKTIDNLLESLNLNNLTPTIILETNKGFHLLYLSKDWIVNESENIFILKHYLQNLTYKLKSLNIDKVFNENYTRIPLSHRKLEFTGIFYTIEDFVVKTNEAYKVFPENIGKEFDLRDYAKIKVSFAPEINKNRLLLSETVCPSLKNILDNPEIQNYTSWLIMARHYANRFNTGDEEAQYIFFSKSMRYPDYNEKQNQNLWDKYTSDKSIIPLSCKFIHENSNLAVCDDCPFGEVKGSPYFRQDSLIIRNPNYIADDKHIYKRISSEDGGENYLVVSKSFKIKDIIQYVDTETITQILTVIETPDGNIHKIPHTNENLPKGLHRAIETRSSRSSDRNALEQIYLDNYAIQTDYKLILPYRLNYFKLGFPSLREEYRDYLETVPYIVYQTEGVFDKWFKSYKEVFEADNIIKFLTGAYLTQFFISTGRSHYLATLNPVILVLGMMGTGKTVRMLIVNSLYTKPDNKYTLENIYSASLPYLAKFQSRVELPVWIDEVKAYNTQEANKFAEIIYFTANAGSRANLSTTKKTEFKCPVVFSGEVNNVKLPQMTAGIFRRVISITITGKYDVNTTEAGKVIVQNLETINKNYGWAHKFFLDFEFNNERFKEIITLVNSKQPKVHTSLKQHLSAIFYMVEEFSKWLGNTYTAEQCLEEFDFIDYERIESISFFEDDEEEVGTKAFWEVVDNYLFQIKEKRRWEGDGASLNYRGEVSTLLSPLTRDEKELFKYMFAVRKKSGNAVKVRFLGSNPLVKYAVGERADIRLDAINRLPMWFEQQEDTIEQKHLVDKFKEYVLEFLERYISEDISRDKIEQVKTELQGSKVVKQLKEELG